MAFGHYGDAPYAQVEAFPYHPTEAHFYAEGIFVFVVEIDAAQIRGSCVKERRVFFFAEGQKPRGNARFQKFSGDPDLKGRM